MNFENLIFQTCYIKPFEYLNGTIIAVHISLKGIEYQVRYYLNGEQRTDYFFNHEIADKGEYAELHTCKNK